MMASETPAMTQPSEDEESRYSPQPYPKEVMEQLDELEAQAILQKQTETDNNKNPDSEPSIIPPSPAKKRKGTDGSSIDKFFPSYKVLSPATYLRKTKVESDDVLDLISTPPVTLSLKMVANGLFCLIYCNKWGSNEEGFPFPFGATTLTSKLVQQDSQEFKFIQETGILAVAARRFSKAQNIPMMKSVGKYDGTFKQTVFVAVLQENTSDMRKVLLNTVEAVSCKA